MGLTVRGRIKGKYKVKSEGIYLRIIQVRRVMITVQMNLLSLKRPFNYHIFIQCQ